jgi:predicted nucleic-acid-binding Zn-ribbon protein
MKTSGRCPKCEGQRIWRIEEVGVKDPQFSNGGNLPLQAVHRKTNEAFPSRYDAGSVDAYVCAACGYSELYWRGLDALQHNPSSGVHMLDARARAPNR